MEKITQFMLENHKRREEATTERALEAWAADAEMCAEINDGAALIEIPAGDCVHGHAVELSLDDSCVDVDIIRESC